MINYNDEKRLVTIGSSESLLERSSDINAVTTGDYSCFAGGSIEREEMKKLVVAGGLKNMFAVLNTVVIFDLQGGATTSSMLPAIIKRKAVHETTDKP